MYRAPGGKARAPAGPRSGPRSRGDLASARSVNRAGGRGLAGALRGSGATPEYTAAVARSDSRRMCRTMLRTIRSRLYLLVALVSAALVAVGAYGGWRASRTRVETELLSNLELARSAGVALDVWLADVAHESRILGRAVAGDRLEPAEAERLLGEAVRDSGTVRDYAWVSPTGQVLVSSEPRLLGVSEAERPELRRLQAGDEIAVGDVVRNPLDGAPVITVATAIRDGSGQLAGALLATIAPDRLAARVLPVRGDEGTASLIDRSGAIVAQLPEGPLSWEERRAAGALDLVRAALTGAEATGSIPTPDRRERLAAAVPVKSLGWAVRASQPGAVVLGPLRREIALGVIAAGLLSVLALIACGAFGRRAAAALRGLERHAEALGRGEAVEPLEGPTEVVRLASAYQEMAEHLRRVPAPLPGGVRGGAGGRGHPRAPRAARPLRQPDLPLLPRRAAPLRGRRGRAAGGPPPAGVASSAWWSSPVASWRASSPSPRPSALRRLRARPHLVARLAAGRSPPRAAGPTSCCW